MFHPAILDWKTWSELGEHGEHGEHGKDGKHQPDDLKHSIYDSEGAHLGPGHESQTIPVGLKGTFWEARARLRPC